MVKEVIRSTRFKKTYKKLPISIQEKFKSKFRIWVKNPFGNFKTEPLKSDKTLWKFSIDNDYRVLFQWRHKFTSVELIGIYTHNELERKGYY